jgi:uncharacterized protein YjbI with pentapeptide repeats
MPKKIEIVSRWDSSKVLYVAKGAADVRAAVEEAVSSGAYLRGAYLGGAYLRGANLGGANLGDAYLGGANLRDAYQGGAYLRGANLGDAYLGGANLRDAYLGGAYLRGANLGDAYLGGANLRDAYLGGAYDHPRHPLYAFRQDYWSILDQAPGEVAGLRKAIVAGKINGSTYSDECGLGCLNGTIANVHGCDLEELRDELGIVIDSNRPAEQWFIAIAKGDKPLPLDTDFKQRSESEFRISYALVWLDEWTESRKAIAKALTPKPKRKSARKKAAKS